SASRPASAFFGGVHQELIGAIQRYDQVAAAFRDGGGVAPADLHPDVWDGTSRFTAQWHQNMLVQQWLPLVPDTTAKLSAGPRVPDPTLRHLAGKAGFGHVRRVEMDNPFNTLYELTR